MVGAPLIEETLLDTNPITDPPIGIEGHFDNMDYISRAESLLVDRICLEEQDKGENPNVGHKQFNEEKVVYP